MNDRNEAESYDKSTHQGDAGYSTESVPAPVSELSDEPSANNTNTENEVVEEFKKDMEKAQADYISSVAAMVSPFDTLRKFIRTADLKFRVADLRKSTYGIEDIIIKYNGFVTYTHLNTSVHHTEKTQISKDSILESIYYNMENTMTLRVPNQHLDTVIRLIGRHIDYLDYRTIQANDITLDLYANKLKQKRLNKFQKRLSNAIDDKGKKLNDIESAENSLLAKAEAEDNALLENLRTMDLVEYSTIQLYLYEREKVVHELIPNDKNVEEYEPSFWSKIGDGFYQGWLAVEALLIGLSKIWFFLLIFALTFYFIFKKLKPFTKTNNEK